jgi:hypothetical protein
VGARATAR